MVLVDDTDGATVAVACVIHQDVDPELGEVPDLESYRQREGVRDVKLGDELPEDQRRVLKDLVRRYPDVFTQVHSGATLVRGLRKILEGSYTDDIVREGKDRSSTYKVLTGSQQNGVSRPPGRR